MGLRGVGERKIDMKAIAAHSLNNVIGKNGTIPWRCSADLRWFKKITLGQTIVVGRTTFEKLPYLPDRNIIVLTHGCPRSPVIGRYEPYQLRFINDIDILPKNSIIAGGAKVYDLLLPYCDTLYLTLIKQEIEGDTVMPAYKHLFSKSVIHEDTPEFTIYEYTR